MTPTHVSAFVPLSDVSVLESPEDVLSTLRADGKRRWMYPTETRGRFWRKRLVLGWALIVLFVALPIIKIGGKPAVLLDVAAREFTFFGTTFYPTDTLYLMLFGISALVSVALLTALLGRVWCGWGCPQTVYLEFVFRPIERLIEGKEHVRQRRDARKELTWDKAWRKGAKWAAYLVISVALAHVFVSYFVGWESLLRWMTSPPTEHWGYFVLMGATTALVAFDFGVFREQMCTITCPYARFQSVLLDEDSMIVSYDPRRGEPRARRGKKAIAEEQAGLRPRSATAWTAARASAPAPPASTSARGSRWSASRAPSASTPATTSWTRRASRVGSSATRASTPWKASRRGSRGPGH